MSSIVVLLCLFAQPGDRPDNDFFEAKIRPVLVERCYGCHSVKSKNLKGGLRLDTRALIRTGGDTGPAIVPGDQEKSLLLLAISYADESLQMPPKGKLPANVIADFRKWVAMGAPDPREGDAFVLSENTAPSIGEGREFWAFKEPRRHAFPSVEERSWPRREIDYFVLSRLEEAGLRPAPDADRYTLLRRVTIDLTGLPPTPEEIEAFASDPSPRAYEKVVDRLLGSPAFGDRWARHWLDLSCYADLTDLSGHVVVRDAWRYRDYVIQAFNDDKPFDRFIHEQIAGDLLPHSSVKERREQVIATGFLAIGNFHLSNYIKGQMHADNVNHMIEKIGRAFLGMSLGCARCHDHKLDPIPTTDYYALAGIFYSTLTTSHDGPGVWSTITETELQEFPEETRKRERALRKYEKDRSTLTANLARLKEAKEVIEKQIDVPGRERDEAQQRRREEMEKTDQEIKEAEARLLLLDFNRPRPPRALSVRDEDKPADTRVRVRGNFQSFGEEVPRGFLTVATRGPAPSISDETSGRRELAEWLTSPEQPLTARVLVNRVWYLLVGAGIVRSVDYFGTKSEPPSHPELLDTLAVRFVEEGWSLKRLIRSIVLSRVYRMSSTHDPVAVERDPDNRLLWRMHRRRLEAEAIRDGLLAVSGQLNTGRCGPCLAFEIPGNVVDLDSTVNLPSYGDKTPLPEVVHRRTIHVPFPRKQPRKKFEILNVFDFPDPSEITAARSLTTVPTQSLFLMNAPFIKERARHTARRLLFRAETDDAGRVSSFFLLALGRPATDTEVEQALQFLREFRKGLETLEEPPADTRREAWVQYCHAVLTSNDFLFRE